jgi:hypothetical protein
LPCSKYITRQVAKDRTEAADWLEADHDAKCLVELANRVRARTLPFLLPGPEEGDALDLGCGAGPDTRLIAMMGYSMSALPE